MSAGRREWYTRLLLAQHWRVASRIRGRAAHGGKMAYAPGSRINVVLPSLRALNCVHREDRQHERPPAAVALSLGELFACRWLRALGLNWRHCVF